MFLPASSLRLKREPAFHVQWHRASRFCKGFQVVDMGPSQAPSWRQLETVRDQNFPRPEGHLFPIKLWESIGRYWHHISADVESEWIRQNPILNYHNFLKGIRFCMKLPHPQYQNTSFTSQKDSLLVAAMTAAHSGLPPAFGTGETPARNSGVWAGLRS